MFDYFYGAEAEQFVFYRIPKVLFEVEGVKEISTDAKLLYGLMLDRMQLSAKNGWLDEEGRVYIYYTLEQVMENMNCARQKAAKLLDELEKGWKKAMNTMAEYREERIRYIAFTLR